MSEDRKARWRERQKAEGVRQINLLAPVAAHPLLKDLAARLRGGEAPADALRAVLQLATAPAPDSERLVKARFAELHGVSKVAVQKWQAQGLLVMDGDKVDVAATDKRLAELGLGRFRAPAAP